MRVERPSMLQDPWMIIQENGYASNEAVWNAEMMVCGCGSWHGIDIQNQSCHLYNEIGIINWG